MNSLLEDLNVKSCCSENDWMLSLSNLDFWSCFLSGSFCEIPSSDENICTVQVGGRFVNKVEFRVVFYYRQLEFSCLCESTAGKGENEWKKTGHKSKQSVAVAKGKIIGEWKEENQIKMRGRVSNERDEKSCKSYFSSRR